MDRKRFVIIGTGTRGLCFAKALTGDFKGDADLVALCDRNPLRMKGFNQLLGTDIPAFSDFPEMVQAVKPTHAIICTPDATHDEVIELVFQHGLEAVCEKPMASDAERVRHILELEKKYKRKVTVTFNYRFIPHSAQLKKILRDGLLGEIRSINVEWLLDKVHGAEYFRRWHSDMSVSGGLFVHKATHHFDLINWILEDEPEQVAAFGALNVYGANGPFRGERCSTCTHAGGECPFEMKTHTVERDKPIFDNLYWNAESGDGYIRDKCVFRKEIDIYDTMTAGIMYRNGAQLAYSLNAYSPIEGYNLGITGTKARLETSHFHSGIMMEGETGENIISIIRGQTREDITVEQIPVATDASAHGGGDNRMYEHLFKSNVPDPLNQVADSRQGAMSCLIGIAANTSAETGRTVRIDELL